MNALNGLTEEYYYSLLINLYLGNKGDVELTDAQFEHLTKLKMQVKGIDYDSASFDLGMEINALPDREQLKRDLENG